MELFYVPNKSLCKKKRPVLTERSVKELVSDWHLSEGFKKDKKTYGSLMNNDIPWQNKWHLKFDPLKSANELGIDQYWSYEAPKLTDFAETTDFDAKSNEKNSISQLGRISKTNIKNMANVVLAGTAHESLKREAYKREVHKAESEADRASTFSIQMKIPAADSGQTKLSMLEKFTLSANKSNRSKVLQNKRQ